MKTCLKIISIGLFVFILGYPLGLITTSEAASTPEIYCQGLPAISCEILNMETTDTLGTLAENPTATFPEVVFEQCSNDPTVCSQCSGLNSLALKRTIKLTVKYCRNRKFQIGTVKIRRSAEIVQLGHMGHCKLSCSGTLSLCTGTLGTVTPDATNYALDAATVCAAIP